MLNCLAIRVHESYMNSVKNLANLSLWYSYITCSIVGCMNLTWTLSRILQTYHFYNLTLHVELSCNSGAWILHELRQESCKPITLIILHYMFNCLAIRVHESYMNSVKNLANLSLWYSYITCSIVLHELCQESCKPITFIILHYMLNCLAIRVHESYMNSVKNLANLSLW